MTPEKALNIALETLEKFEFIPEAYDNQYTKLCATALEKQIPQKAYITRCFGICPRCKAEIKGYINYCDLCGQAIKWRD